MTNDHPAETTEGSRLGRAIDRGWNRVDQIWINGADRVRSSRVGRWWTGVERPSVADWALLGVILAVGYVTFLYGDVQVTFEHSFNFLDAVFAGRIQDFYAIAIENASYGHPAVYDIPIYAVFGLWNLPTYLMARLGDFDYLHSTPAYLWLKLMLVAFTILSAWLLMKIARQMGVSRTRSKWAAFYFLSSMSVAIPIFVTVQYDIIAIAMILAGVLAYMKGNTRAFLFWFLLANTFKLFALFVFIPLILLREKRPLRAGLQLAVGLLGLLACRLLYRGDVAFEASTGGFNQLMLDRLGVVGVPWVSGMIPAFVVFMILIAIFAYAKRVTSERELQALAIYLPLAAFLAFCALVPLHPYWITLAAPFAILIIFANPRFLTLNSSLELAFSAAVFLIYLQVGYSMYNAGLFSDLVFGQFVPPASPQRFTSPGEVLTALGLSPDRVFLLVGVLAASLIAILVLNYPTARFVEGMPNAEPIRRSVVWIRLAAVAASMGLLFVMYLYPARPEAYVSTTDSPTLTSVDILAPGSSVEEELTFDASISVDEIKVGLDASAIAWVDSALVKVELLDESGSVTWSDEVPANSVGVGLTAFRTPGLVLGAGTSYTLRLSGADYENEPLYVQVNPDEDRFETTQNGEPVDGDLVLIIVGTKEL